MRIPLYRAKAINREPNRVYRTDYKNGDWVYGLVSELYKYHDKYIAKMTNTDGVSSIDVDPNTICEYTGLTDKNGKKIFEGDIVKYSDEECFYREFMGEVVFEKGAFGIGCKDELPIDLDYWCDNDNFVSLWELYWNLNCTKNELPMIEVIGNIHDTADLLKN